MKYIRQSSGWALKKFRSGTNHWHKFNYIIIGIMIGLLVGFFVFHEESDLDRRVRDIAVASYPDNKEKQNLAVRQFRSSIDELYEFSQSGGVARARDDALDQETKNDLNLIHAKLEDHYKDNGYYPTEITQSVLEGISYDSLIDRGGKFIHVETSNINDEPADYFGLSAPEQRYRYAAYGCEVDTGQAQDYCRSYVLFGWLETGGVYSRKSLN